MVYFTITLAFLCFGWLLLNGKTALAQLKQKIKQDETQAEKFKNED